MFILTKQPLEELDLKGGLAANEAGGFVAFEGLVRNHNEGKSVICLEYDAFPALAEKEANKILAEARSKFKVVNAKCVHRTGKLEVGEMAVWVGVTAVHRDEAFQACRYIIDNLKARVPIWKKEYYATGDSGWVNCEACRNPSHRHPESPREHHIKGSEKDSLINLSKKFSITTKAGDKGLTRLYSGEKVSKSSPLIEACGEIDEIVSVLSIARHYSTHEDIKADILFIQRSLFAVASELATTPKKQSELPKKVDAVFLERLEEKREKLESSISIPRDFVIPGNTLAAAYLDFARTIARRCERKIVGLWENKTNCNEILLVWMNRLSDYLYLLARKEEESPLFVKEDR